MSIEHISLIIYVHSLRQALVLRVYGFCRMARQASMGRLTGRSSRIMARSRRPACHQLSDRILWWREHSAHAVQRRHDLLLPMNEWRRCFKVVYLEAVLPATSNMAVKLVSVWLFSTLGPYQAPPAHRYLQIWLGPMCRAITLYPLRHMVPGAYPPEVSGSLKPCVIESQHQLGRSGD